MPKEKSYKWKLGLFSIAMLVLAVGAIYYIGKQKNKFGSTVTIKLVAGKDGVTNEANDEGSTLRDQSVVACIAGEFRKITYPRSGGELTALYPVQFAP